MESKAEETFSTPPPFFLSGGSLSEQNVRAYHVNSPVDSLPPPVFSPLPEGGFGKHSSVYHIQSSLSSPPPPVLSPLPGESVTDRNVRVYHIHSPNNPPPPSSFSPPQVSGPMFVSYESRPYRSPALTTCVSCRTQVTTEVTFKVGAYAWLLCLVFVFCGLVLGCCLIPFFVNHFKDAYHTCPRCKRVLHIQRRECCE
ncbi:lipopolysaccharide-induced tumor necrosis factor-alpha factor homolog isoform X2 [Kryptolebias marmoratus]|uniref:lipopolysaccharide-induced tumor necrosis factor-alpha factor homolog isoform X2 n=1 Tax=Kryptolebias marmoratus TaxID=37003 RepID=UPI0007F88900|nr:lipopolysaccharide-induced tumor necrosis factor-alpha factor homolog isoform X2 [Kryptolebias marmoratus]